MQCPAGTKFLERMSSKLFGPNYSAYRAAWGSFWPVGAVKNY